MTVTAVVFDIGNVLIEWQPERFYDAEYGPERRKELFATVDLHDMNEAVDAGADWREEVDKTKAAFPEFAPMIEDWHSRWLEMARPTIDHSVRLMRALKTAGVPVLALSNFGIGTFELARQHYDFLDEFDDPYISGYLGCTKPGARIYEIVEERSGHAPGGLLFVDDRAENIAAAAARGWQTHVFDGPQGWAQRLLAEGLLRDHEAT